MPKFSELLSEVGMVPASAKVDKIENQWLEPTSHDEKLIKPYRDAKVFDQTNDKDPNYKLSKDTSKSSHTTSKGNPETPKVSIKEDSIDVAETYRYETWNLLEEVTELMEKLEDKSPYSYSWSGINSCMRSLRDSILTAIPSTTVETSVSEEEQITEAEEVTFSKGKMKLKDGTSVTITTEDAKALNNVLSTTHLKSEMYTRATKNLSEYKKMLTFSKNVIQESLTGVGVADPALDSTPEIEKDARKKVFNAFQSIRARKKS